MLWSVAQKLGDYSVAFDIAVFNLTFFLQASCVWCLRLVENEVAQLRFELH